MQDANRLLTDLQSPYWWITAVLVAVAVNLLSAYLKLPVDNWLEKRSQKRRQSIETNQKATQVWAKFLLQDARLLHLTETRLITLKLEILGGAAVLALELVLIYYIGEIPTTPKGWITVILAFILITSQTMLILWKSEEVKVISARLNAVEHWLQDRILGPSTPAVEESRE